MMAIGIWISLPFNLGFLVKNNKVMTVKHGVEALSMLRMRPYDLVVSDVHMPDMDGFQLHHHIKKEFQLPVILISADDREEVVRNGMANGAAQFLVKPFKCDDFRDLWQFSVYGQKFKNPAIPPKIGPITCNQYDNLMLADNLSRRCIHRRQNNNDFAGHIATSYAATAAIDVHDNPRASRTANLVWTTALHTRFVEAILIIGYDRAIPTTILEVMNVPGLTREQVASHLQKYRKFLKRVLDEETDMKSSDWIDLDYYSSYVSGNPNLLLLKQLNGKDEDRDLENHIQQQDSNIPVPSTSSSSILNPPASTTTLIPSRFKALSPFTEAASTSRTKKTINEMMIQQTPMPTQGNTLVVVGRNTDYGFLTDVATGNLGGSTSPYNNTGHVGSSSSAAPSVGKSLSCFDVPNNQMTYSNSTTAALQNYLSGGFSEINNNFSLINHVGPSSAPFSTSYHSQWQPFNNEGQNSVLFSGNNTQSFGDQQNYVEQLPNISSPFCANRFGVSSVMNELVNDLGNIGFVPDDNYLAAFNQNTNPNPNQEENEEGEDNFLGGDD